MFKFDLNDEVEIICSGECGLVIGRAEYSKESNQYFVRYKSADGRAVEQWWSESALAAEY
ncbi:phage protein [Vibrio ishigakensis]|uniref:Phage protein n=1 Tax=Vibrio ishigakensis TaxID=1481914 RepID=A0A0B8PKK4_9VIBR|nr:phage protein [Vibrio ishigakensis]